VKLPARNERGPYPPRFCSAIRDAQAHSPWLARPGAHQIANHCSHIIHRKPSARTRRSLVAAAVQWAERIMRKIDRLIMCFLDEVATQMKLKLKARVNRSDARTIQ
jgi:hypothetical protein